MIELIFFDFDGVIVESVDIKTRAFAELFEHEGNNIVEKVVEYHLNNTGVSRYEKIRHIYKEVLKRPLDNKTFQSLCDRFAGIVMDKILKAPYVEGASEFLNEHSQKYKCFIVSATPQNEIEEIIEKRNIRRFFKAIYGAPTQKTFAVREILLDEKVSPENSVYIGDALSDYNASHDNTVNFIARINNNDAIFENIACLKINDLTNLNKILETL